MRIVSLTVARVDDDDDDDDTDEGEGREVAEEVNDDDSAAAMDAGAYVVLALTWVLSPLT